MEHLIQIQNIRPIQQSTPVSGIKGADPFSQLQAGDTVEAVVSQADAGGLTLTLPDGTELHASMQAGQAIEAQDTLTMQLTSSESGAVRLRLISVNSQPVTADIPLTELELMQLQLPPSRANVAAANLLRNLDLPVNAESLARFSLVSQSAPALLPEQAAVFAASNIAATPENIEAFQNFLQSPVQLEEFASAIKNALSRPQEGVQSGAGNIAGTPEQAGAQSPLSPSSEPLIASAAQAQTQNAQALPEQSPEAGKAQGAAPNPPAAPSLNEAPPAAAQDKAQSSAPLPSGGTPAFDENTVSNALRSIFPKLLPEESASLGRALQKAVPSLSSRVAALTESATAAESSNAKQAGQIGSQFVQQMQFGNEMSSLFYTQIPFSYQEKQQNAELYILKRRSSGNEIDAGNATIALCLETQHIGMVESLVQVKQDDLHFCFRVETPQIRDFVQGQIDELSKVKFPAQYSYRGSSVSLIEAPITPINAAKTLRDTFDLRENNSGVDIVI